LLVAPLPFVYEWAEAGLYGICNIP